MVNFCNLRIGHGIDVHGFKSGDYVTLGGVVIPYHLGLRAHSDGDVIIHALVDALLGACALGDIGQYFPDSKKCWENCSSRVFLRESVKKLKEKNFFVVNVDITVLAESPKLNPYREKIISNLAKDMEINTSQVNIKGTTMEKMGFIGRKEGIAATAVALIQKNFNLD